MARMMNRLKQTPVDIPKTLRQHTVTTMTSFKAGKVVPVVAIPIYREDQVVSGALQIQVAMEETEELLLNPVNGVVSTWFVPFSAFERFGGSLDIYDRSYMGQPPMEGETVIPWLEKFAYGDINANEIHKSMGLHGKATDMVSTAYVEAYNLIDSVRRGMASPSLEKRDRLDKTLAPAFWPTSRFDHIVADWDQASSNAEVPLTVAEGKLPIKGLGITKSTGKAFATPHTALNSVSRENGITVEADPGGYQYAGDGNMGLYYRGANGTAAADIYAELQQNGIRVSLQNIELAKQTQAWALLRKQYAEHDEQWLIDMYMSGLTAANQDWKHPILMSEQKTVFGMAVRRATDAANLDKQAVNGAAVVNVRLNFPQCRVGGIIMVLIEALPEQMFERTQDYLLHLESTADLPDAMPDYLDPEKVEIVRNDYVDTSHNDPDGLYGYAPLNHKLMVNAVRIGGKFMRPTVDGTNDEDRQRLWAVETPNPKLGANTILATDVHQKPFKDTTSHPFEAVILGVASIRGLTQFGATLAESGDEYDAVLEKVDQSTIEKE